MLVVLPLGYSHCKVCGTVDRCAEAFKGSFGKVKTALAISERHRCWLRKRLAPEGAREGWRPQKVFRSAARKWVKTIDNQVRYSSSWLGIAHVRFVGDSPLWSPASWRSWPLLQCVQDQGADCVAGWHAMAYGKGCNSQAVWDWPHGLQNDWEGALRRPAMWSLVLLLMVVVNMGHGPDRDECQRFAQVQDMMSFLFEFFTPDSCLLFEHYASAMLDELGTLVPIDVGQAPTEALWAYLKEKAAFPKLGHKTKLCQFMGAQRALAGLLPNWTETLFKAELLCLELDFFAGKSFKEQADRPTHRVCATGWHRLCFRALDQQTLVFGPARLPDSDCVGCWCQSGHAMTLQLWLAAGSLGFGGGLSGAHRRDALQLVCASSEPSIRRPANSRGRFQWERLLPTSGVCVCVLGRQALPTLAQLFVSAHRSWCRRRYSTPPAS